MMISTDVARRAVVGHAPAMREVARKMPPPRACVTWLDPPVAASTRDERDAERDDRNAAASATRRSVSGRSERARASRSRRVRDQPAAVGAGLAPADRDERERRGARPRRERGPEQHRLDLVRDRRRSGRRGAGRSSRTTPSAATARARAARRRSTREEQRHEQRVADSAAAKARSRARRSRSRARSATRARAPIAAGP